jgi:NADH-quinone oxidoreductase subunit L
MISEAAVWAIWALPLAAFVIISALVPTGVFRRGRMPWLAPAIAVSAIFISFCLSLWALSDVWGEDGHAIGFATREWLDVGPLTIDMGIRLDGLTAMMLVVVTSVSFLVQFYSVEYIRGDRGFARYFAIISLFTMAMLGLVIADNLLMAFVFWELVGLCSYLLIGFWFDRESPVPDQLSPRDSAMKAFLITRLGDVGFLLALILIWNRTGTFNIVELTEMAEAGAIGQTTLLLFCLGIFAGAAGKSAQFPLHTWLPDAMAGPTPVSALIHAATMVAAGVYLVGRLFPIYEVQHTTPNDVSVLEVITYIGAITALIAATMGMVMHDIKRVLAYSTISQLGYMMLGLGVGGFVAAFFHLMTHAFFKALLFLGSGSVSHSTNTFDMRLMGGLRRYMPITFITFLIGSLSLAGIFPLAGFWSKDEILRDAWNAETTASTFAFYAAMAVVFMTAFYMFRAVSMTFLGDYRGGGEPVHHGDDEPEPVPVATGAGHGDHAGGHGVAVATADDHGAPDTAGESSEPGSAAAHGPAHGLHDPHESPWIITVPLIILAIPAIFAGLLNAGGAFGHQIGHLLEGSLPEFARHAAGEFNWPVAIVSSGLAVLGIVSALTVYGFGARWQVGLGPLRPVYRLIANRYFLDDVYEKGIARGLVYGVIGGICQFLDTRLVDGIVNGVAWVTRRLAFGLTRIQSGQQQAYSFVFMAGVALIAAVVFWVTV